ncbi:MAG: glutathione S-transferase N-terminal domain-containing protein [Sphingorhabdus sp.]
MIDLYTSTTPNGRKISIALEEMGLPYEVHAINLQNNEQFAPDFLKISPNNKIPAIVDRDNGLSVFESGAILTYLAEKSDQFLPTGGPERIRVLEWLAWQTAGLGPMLGQLNHFLNVADEKLPYAIKRFSDEMVRLLGVLDKQLANHKYVAGDYSIADMAIYPWSSAAYEGAKGLIGDAFKNLETWHVAMAARPAVQAGMAVPET